MILRKVYSKIYKKLYLNEPCFITGANKYLLKNLNLDFNLLEFGYGKSTIFI